MFALMGILVVIALVATQVDDMDKIRERRYMVTPMGYTYYYV